MIIKSDLSLDYMSIYSCSFPEPDGIILDGAVVAATHQEDLDENALERIR